MSKQWFVYVLKSLKDGKYYIGYTSNLERRLEEHNSGKQRSTKHRAPFELVHYEVFHSKSDAIKREKQLKSYKGGEAFKRLLENRGA